MGFQPFRQWCDRFGLGRHTGVDLPYEKFGNLPGSTNVSADATRRFEREALGLVIGQSSLTVTPLQMTRAMAAIANGGWLVTPHVVSPDGMLARLPSWTIVPAICRAGGFRDCRRTRCNAYAKDCVLLSKNRTEQGTRTVRLKQVRIAGKTGTAETGGRPDHAWFSGYVPADDPKYAFAVVLEHGGSGSRAAGPVARELVRKMVDLGLRGTGKVEVAHQFRTFLDPSCPCDVSYI